MNNLALPRQLRSSLTNRIRFSSGATAISSSLSSSAAAATATVRHTTIKTVTTITSSHAICYRSLSSSSTSRTSSPLKLTKDEVEASLRLIGYQGTPFPWLQVSMYTFIVVSGRIGMEIFVSQNLTIKCVCADVPSWFPLYPLYFPSFSFSFFLFFMHRPKKRMQ